MPATIFSGDKVKALKKKLKLGEGAEVISTTLDPSAGAGLAAPIGTIALNETTGAMYQKTGAGDTAWVVASSTGALPTAGGTMTGNITFGTGFGDVTSGGLVAGKLINKQLLIATTSTTYTPTVGTRLIHIFAVGGGGGSGGLTATSSTTVQCTEAGGHGGFVEVLAKVTDSVGTYSCGTGGTAGTSAPTNGGTGGTTTFQMGAGGASINISCAGGVGGVAGSITGAQQSSQGQTDGVATTPTGSNIIYSSKSNALAFGNNSKSRCMTADLGTLQFGWISHGQSHFGKLFCPTPATVSFQALSSLLLVEDMVIPADDYGRGSPPKFRGGTASNAPGGTGNQGAIMIFEYA